MSYADYEFYNSVYCGNTVCEDDFTYFSQKASKKLDAYVGGRLDESEITDEVRLAVCEIADILCEAESRIGIEYERNDGYWVSYEASMTSADRIKSAVFTWLSGSGLLYRGRSYEA